MNQPLITIAVITYNSSKYVSETLESLTVQDYKNIEIIISDDCSTDNTYEICKKWVYNNHQRFVKCHLIKTSNNRGISGNYNHALEYCNGEWIKFIAGDNRLKPNCITEFVNKIEKEDDVMSCLMEEFYNNKPDRVIRGSNALREKKQLRAVITNYYYSVLTGATLFIKRDYLILKRGFEEKYRLLEDYPFCMRYLIEGGKIKQIELPLIEYRSYDESISNSNTEFRKNLNEALIDYLPKAALKCRLYFHWYHYKILCYKLKHTQNSSKFHRVIMRLFDFTDPLSYWIYLKYHLSLKR